MNKESGFSITECLVYCSLFCLLCALIFKWVGASQVSLAGLHKKASSVLDTYGAWDSLSQDIMGAPTDSISWKKITEQEIIWQGNETAIGWTWINGSLYRITGIYDNTQWTQQTKSLVSNAITRVHFSVERNKWDDVVGVACDLGSMVRRISLRNRRLHGQS